MARYIDAKLAQHIADIELGTSDRATLQWVLSHTPTADVVDVVRCKDCVYFRRKDENFNSSECESCGDINEPCGFCSCFGFCASTYGYCYKGARRKE